MSGFLNPREAMMAKQEISIFIANEQPETCRYCGGRTEFTELNAMLQIHSCSICRISYQLEFEEEAA